MKKQIKELSFERQLKEQFVEATGHHFQELLDNAKKEGRKQTLEEVEKIIDDLESEPRMSDLGYYSKNFTKELKTKIKQEMEK